MLLEFAGVRLVTDPLLRGRLGHLRRHAAPVDVPRDVDAVLISHVHHDHLDGRSLRRLAGPRTVVVAPAGAGRLVRKMRFASVLEVRAGDAVDIGGLGVEVVAAWHGAVRRWPWTADLGAVGFLVDRVWFAGDTGLHADLAELRGRVDVALLPIWGWGPSVGAGHLDPAAAAAAVELVQPRTVVPIHWGTLLPFGLRRTHGHLLRTPAVEFAAHVERQTPGVRVVTLDVGDGVLL